MGSGGKAGRGAWVWIGDQILTLGLEGRRAERIQEERQAGGAWMRALGLGWLRMVTWGWRCTV